MAINITYHMWVTIGPFLFRWISGLDGPILGYFYMRQINILIKIYVTLIHMLSLFKYFVISLLTISLSLSVAALTCWFRLLATIALLLSGVSETIVSSVSFFWLITCEGETWAIGPIPSSRWI